MGLVNCCTNDPSALQSRFLDHSEAQKRSITKMNVRGAGQPKIKPSNNKKRMIKREVSQSLRK